MRGCLAVLVLAAAFGVAVVWVAGPPVAAGIVTVGLGLTGFEAEDTAVTVVADPPLDLLGGRADELRISASNAAFGGLTAATVDLVLVDVGIVERSAASVSGRLDGVVVGATDERLAVASIAFDGAADEADAVARVSAGAIEALAARAIESRVGTAPDGVRLVAPDRLTFTVAGVSAEARLAADDSGNLVAVGVPGSAGPIVLVAAESTAPFELNGLAVEGGQLVVRGTLDVEALVR